MCFFSKKTITQYLFRLVSRWRRKCQNCALFYYKKFENDIDCIPRLENLLTTHNCSSSRRVCLHFGFSLPIVLRNKLIHTRLAYIILVCVWRFVKWKPWKKAAPTCVCGAAGGRRGGFCTVLCLHLTCLLLNRYLKLLQALLVFYNLQSHSVAHYEQIHLI